MKILWMFGAFLLADFASAHAVDIQTKDASASSPCPYPYSFFHPQQPRITSLPSTTYLMPRSVVWSPWYVGPVYIYSPAIPVQCSSPRLTIKIRF